MPQGTFKKLREEVSHQQEFSSMKGTWQMNEKKKDQTKHKCVVKAKNLVSHAGMNDEILNFECNLHIIHTFCGSVHVHTDPN